MHKTSYLSARNAVCTLGATALLVLSTGCAMTSQNTAHSASSPAASPGGLSGNVHGGQQPVVGGTIQLYEVGTTGYSTGLAKPILTKTVTTDANGMFAITGDYTCDAGAYVYITAAGGNPGSGTNANLAEMAALGPCSVLLANASSTFIAISEETTVAAAYALAQFSGRTAFGTPLSAQAGVAGSTAPADNFTTSSTNVQGLANAMAIAQVIANTSTGTSPGSNTNGTATPEYWQVHTLSDILAACINSTGTTTGAGDGTACGTLFANVNVPAGTNPATGSAYAAPADTIQAAIYMALNPTITATQQTSLFGLIPASPPYQPYVASAAKLYDLTLAVSYLPVVPGTSTALLYQPAKVALDAYGNVWITNNPTNSAYNGTAANNGFLVELDPTGNPIQTGATAGTSASNYQITGYSVGGSTTNTTMAGLNNGTATPGSFPFLDEAIDASNNVWVPDYMKNAVARIVGSGPAYTSSGYATGLHNGGNGNDAGGSGAVGYTLPATGGGTGNGVTSLYPTTIAVDGNNDVFVTTNAGTASTTEALSCATYATSSGVSTSGDKGLLTFVAGSATNVQYSRFVGAPYSPIAVDGGTADKIAGTTIPGSPFVWGLGYNQGGTNVSIGSQYAGLLSQNYSTTGGVNTQFPNSSLQGCATPLSYSYVSASSTNIGISSTLDTSAVTAISGALGSNATNTTQVSVVPSVAGGGDAAAYMMGSPYGMSIDGSGNVWVSNTGYEDSTSATAGSGTNGTVKASLTKITPSYGSSFTPANAAASFSYTVFHDIGGMSSTAASQPRLLTADGGGNLWFTLNIAGATVGAITASGTAFSPAYATTNIGFLGSACPATCTFTGSSTAYTRSNGPKQIAIDGSGNVWIPQQGANSNEVTMIVGSAVPVATPFSLAIKNGTFGTRP